MDTVLLLRCAYLGAALAVILVSVTPPLRHRFLAYGARASNTPLSSSIANSSGASASTPASVALANGKSVRGEEDSSDAPTNSISRLLDIVAQWKVPHSYFWTFYFLSTTLSAFWLAEVLFLHGPAYQAIASRTAHRTTAMSLDQLKITWTLFFLHCVWRLNECLSAPSFSQPPAGRKRTSKMWIGHWLLGILFYILTSLAIWIEGFETLEVYTPSYKDLAFRAPSLRTIGALLIFIFASGVQRDCHAYLADLKGSKHEQGKSDENGYRIPTHPAFHSFIAPHYTAECFKYFALALLAAPPGQWLNWTLSCALVFVVANLGVTARGTRLWYEEKFGRDAVKNKWNLIPGVY